MGNPYTEAYAPQMMADQTMQPFFQDTRGQQALQQQMMQQQMQNMQPGTAQQSAQGPMQLAQALRMFGKGRQGPQSPSLEPSNLDRLKGWWSSATAPTPYDIQP